MIKIVYLYKDLLGLYGEYANIETLVKRLEAGGCRAKVEVVDVGEKLDLKNTDFLYVGAGTEGRMLAAVHDFYEKKDAVLDYLISGGTALATGNSLALFANTITDIHGNIYNGIGAVDAEVVIDSKRRYAEFIMSSTMTDEKTVGAINTSITVKTAEKPLFSVDFASADILKSKTEGIRKGDLFLTQLTGPLLVRNPALLDWFARRISGKNLSPCVESWHRYLSLGYENVFATLSAAAGSKK